MRYRVSDLPNQGMWSNLFDQIFMLQTLELTTDIENYFDISCGYGTLTSQMKKSVPKRCKEPIFSILLLNVVNPHFPDGTPYRSMANE